MNEATIRKLTETEPETVAFASCPTGKTAIGGGAALARLRGGDVGKVAITRSVPQFDGTVYPAWMVQAKDFTDEPVFVNDVVITVFAICVDNPDYPVVP